MQQALEVLDPRVAKWWKANSVVGEVRARDAAFYQQGAYTFMEGGRPIVVVDQGYTAGQTAQAIIAEAKSGWFADSVGAFYKRYRFAQNGSVEEFRKWQAGATVEAARLASLLAELYVGTLATLTPSGELVVAAGDLVENGPGWNQLLSLLPLAGHLPVGAIVVQFGQRQVRLRKAILQRLELLSDAERNNVLKALRQAKDDKEATAIIRTAVLKIVDERQIHHAISETVFNALDKHPLLKGKYTLRDPRFEALAIDSEAHRGWQKWHQTLDKEVADWIRENQSATPEVFEAFLKKRYDMPDLRARFPDGLGRHPLDP